MPVLPTHADQNDIEDWSGIADGARKMSEPFKERVYRFGRMIVRNLLFNYEKGGWSPDETPFLTAKMIEEVGELLQAVGQKYPGSVDPRVISHLRAAVNAQMSKLHDDQRPHIGLFTEPFGDVKSEAGDVSAMAMMFFDNERGGFTYEPNGPYPDDDTADALRELLPKDAP